MILNERLPDILDKAFDGDDTNQLYEEIANGQMNTAKSTQKKLPNRDARTTTKCW
jgi:hypothetical protein